MPVIKGNGAAAIDQILILQKGLRTRRKNKPLEAKTYRSR